MTDWRAELEKELLSCVEEIAARTDSASPI
jgi:hypothetical protein